MRIRRIAILAPLIALFTLTAAGAADVPATGIDDFQMPKTFGNMTVIAPTQHIDFGFVATFNWRLAPRGPAIGFGGAAIRVDGQSGELTGVPTYGALPAALTWPRPVTLPYSFPDETDYAVVVNFTFPLPFCLCKR